MHSHRRIMAASTILLSATTLAAEPTTLQALEVTGQQLTPEQEAPALKTTVDAEKLESINSPNVSDALKYEPSLVVRKRYIGDRNATLSFRDMHTKQTPRALVYGDGLLLSNLLGANFGFAPRWSVMQPEEIERVEVLYGPYSAEYSGNALGGVVILHSRMPDRFEAQLSTGAFWQDFGAYGTDDTFSGHTLHASVGDRQDRWSYFLAVDRLENESHPQSFNITSASGGPATGNPVTGAFHHPRGGFLYNSSGPSDVVENLFKLKVGYDLTDSLESRFTLAYLEREEDDLSPETYLRDADGNPVHNGTVDIEGQSYSVRSRPLGLSEARDLVYGAELEGMLGNSWSINSAFSFYDVLGEEDRQSGVDFAEAQAHGPGNFTEDQGSGWQTFDIKLGHHHDGGWLGQRVLFGYHFDRYVLDKAIFNTDNWHDASISDLDADSRGNTRVHALFAENEWQLTRPWTLVLGARQEWWKADNGSLARDFDGSRLEASYPGRSESRFSPKASLSYQPNPYWLATLSLGIAYRFPTVGELYQGSIDDQGDFSTSFDPDLKTEKGFAKNLMIRRFFDKATVTFNLWENDVDDAIFSQRSILTGISNFQNIDRVRSRGAELVTNVQDLGVPGLDVDFNVAYTRARILENRNVPDSEGKQFPRVPEWRANLFASYRATDRLKLGAGARYASDPYDQLDNSDGDLSDFGYTDGFLVFDTRATYDVNNNVTLAGGLDNIADERYYVYHPYPGRTVFAELKWQY